MAAGGHIGFWDQCIKRCLNIARECVIPLEISTRKGESILGNIFRRPGKYKMAMG